MNSQPDLFSEEDKTSFEAAFAWWEKRRLRYNLIVGVAGVLLTLLRGWHILGIWTFISIFIIGLAANAFYCLGYLIEFFLKYYFHSKFDFADRRKTFYITGILFSLFVLFILAALYFFTPGFPPQH